LALEQLPHHADTRLVLIAPATETSTAVKHAFSMLALNDPAVQTAFHQLIYEVGGKPTEWYSIRRAMKNIHAKVLWIHDEEDDITPLSDALKVKEAQYPNITFIITKGLGHRKIYHDASIKKQVIDFL
jgi:pimeloyl-ACP methyl ester carboxylesterase